VLTRSATRRFRPLGSELAPRRSAAEDALVTNPAHEAVRVDALQEGLRRPAGDAGPAAEAGERDLPGALALLDERALGLLVGADTDGEAVTDAHQPAACFQESRKVAVVDPDRAQPGLLELGLQRLGLLGLVSKSRGRPREEDLAASPLELQERQDRLRPRRSGEQVACGKARIERRGLGSEGQPRPRLAANLLQPLAREVPVAGLLDRAQALGELRRRQQCARR